MAHINLDEAELKRIYPVFKQTLEYLDSMQEADKDQAAFPAGLVPASSIAAGVRADSAPKLSPDSQKVNHLVFRSDIPENTALNNDTSAQSIENLLDNAGERDGRFLVIPNVL